MLLHIQSMHIPSHTPISPRFIFNTKKYDKTTRNIHILRMLMLIVYFASPPLRRICGRVKLNAQKNMLNILKSRMTSMHMILADSDKW